MSAVGICLLVFLGLLLMYVGFMCGAWRSYKQGYDEEIDPPRAQPRRPGLRRFYVQRHKDVTGVSGTGVVVEGVVFSDGWGVSHWLSGPPMNEPKTEIWHKPWYRRKGPDPFTKISGHSGNTVVVWIDES